MLNAAMCIEYLAFPVAVVLLRRNQVLPRTNPVSDQGAVAKASAILGTGSPVLASTNWPLPVRASRRRHPWLFSMSLPRPDIGFENRVMSTQVNGRAEMHASRYLHPHANQVEGAQGDASLAP